MAKTVKVSKDEAFELGLRERIVSELSAEAMKFSHLFNLATKEFGEYAGEMLAKYKVSKGAQITQIDYEKSLIVVEEDGKDSS